MKKLSAALLVLGLSLTGCSTAPVWTSPVDTAALQPGEIAVVDGTTVMVTADGKTVAQNAPESAKLVPQFDFTYPGSELGVSGKGWRAGDAISVSLWDSTGKVRVSERTLATVDKDGTFSVVHQIGELEKGTYTLKAGQSKPADVSSARIGIR